MQSWTVDAKLTTWSDIRAELLNNLLGRKVIEDEAVSFLVAIEELFVNIVMYAYSDNNTTKGEITVVCKISENCKAINVSIQLIDHGAEFDPTAYAERPPIGKEKYFVQLGGWGIKIARSKVDSLNYIREDHKNILTIEKSFERK